MLPNSSKTMGTMSPSPTTNLSSDPSTSNSIFTVVFITSVAVASFLFLCVIALIVCCSIRRKRTAIVTKPKKNRTFEDGPLYAVTTLNTSRYTGIREDRRDQTPDSTHSSMNTDISETKPRDNKHIYERYLTPIDGLPGQASSSRSEDRGQDSGYLQPVGGIPVPDVTSPGTNDRPLQRQEPTRNRIANAAKVNNNLYDEVSPMVK